MELKPGFYRHYKGNFYEVLGVGKFDQPQFSDEFFKEGFHSEDLSKVQVYRQNGTFVLEGSDISGLEFVVYQAQYGTDDFGYKPVWVRPLKMFMGTVQVDGKEMPRFKYIGPKRLK